MKVYLSLGKQWSKVKFSSGLNDAGSHINYENYFYWSQSMLSQETSNKKEVVEYYNEKVDS